MPKFRKGQTVKLNQYYAGIPIGSSGPITSEPTKSPVAGTGYYVEFIMYDVTNVQHAYSRWVPEKILDKKDFLEHLADQYAEAAYYEELP